VRIEDTGTVVAYHADRYYLRTFSYVETTEPLNGYKIDHRAKGKGAYRQKKSCP
jgi:hypothetical protein